MPCVYDDSAERAEHEKARRQREKDLTECFCEAMTVLENLGLLAQVSARAKKLWATHEKAEEARLRAEAMEKLTPRERRILGLDKVTK